MASCLVPTRPLIKSFINLFPLSYTAPIIHRYSSPDFLHHPSPLCTIASKYVASYTQQCQLPLQRALTPHCLQSKLRSLDGAPNTLRSRRHICTPAHHHNRGRRSRRYSIANLPPNIVPIVPQTTSIKYTSDTGLTFPISGSQLPLLPAYAYTDYKSQGRSLASVIVDLNGCRSLQSFYVTLSRATSLRTVAVLRSFKARTMTARLGEDFRGEFERLEMLGQHSGKPVRCMRSATSMHIRPRPHGGLWLRRCLGTGKRKGSDGSW